MNEAVAQALDELLCDDFDGAHPDVVAFLLDAELAESDGEPMGSLHITPKGRQALADWLDDTHDDTN